MTTDVLILHSFHIGENDLMCIKLGQDLPNPPPNLVLVQNSLCCFFFCFFFFAIHIYAQGNYLII